MPRVRDILEIVAAFVVAWLFYQGLSFAAGTPMPIVSVASGSMEPILYKGDLAFVLRPDNLQVGDIIIYDPKPDCFNVQHTIVHRVIEITDDGKIRTRGDNNPGPDKCPVDVTDIHGKVILAAPLLGYPRIVLYEITGI